MGASWDGMANSATTTLSLRISGMHCDHCVRAVDAALTQLPGVLKRDVRVGSADVELDEGSTGRADLFDAIRRAGPFDLIEFSVSE